MTASASYRRILTRMGYYGYQNGLIYRHLNQSGGWDGHLERCRSFILRAVDLFSPVHITVIGSGWLLDLPLAELSERTSKITLIDIIHPPDVRKQTAGMKNVELVEADATGGLISEIWDKTGRFFTFKKLRSLAGISVPEFIPAEDPGMVVSLNIITQLEACILESLGRRSRVGSNEIMEFRKEIQEKHIDFLKKHPSVLISDYEEVVSDKKGEKTSVTTLFADLPEAAMKEEWTWDFDIHGSDYYTNISTMKVVALAF